jgi:hypothetical protein
MRFCGEIFLILLFAYGFLLTVATGYSYNEGLAKKMMFLAAGGYADTTQWQNLTANNASREVLSSSVSFYSIRSDVLCLPGHKVQGAALP